MLLKSKIHQAYGVNPFYLPIIPLTSTHSHPVNKPACIINHPLHLVHHLLVLHFYQIIVSCLIPTNNIKHTPLQLREIGNTLTIHEINILNLHIRTQNQIQQANQITLALRCPEQILETPIQERINHLSISLFLFHNFKNQVKHAANLYSRQLISKHLSKFTLYLPNNPSTGVCRQYF